MLTQVQRQHLDLPNGQVGAVSGPRANQLENVLVVLDRLHALWSIGSGDYGDERRDLAGVPAGQSVDQGRIGRTIAAIRRNEEPTIAPAVAQHFLNIILSAAIGPGQPNTAADITALQRFFRARDVLPGTVLTAEQVASNGVDLSTIPRTRAALIDTKKAIARGVLGWLPVHTAEGELGGDKFGGQTFRFVRPEHEIDRTNAAFGQYSIFVPRGAGTANNVRLHFSAGGVLGSGGTNAVLQHGLRSASDGSGWITIAIPGIDNTTANTITMAEIQACLDKIGRPTRVDALMLTAHSRGVLSLSATLRAGAIPGALVQQVVLYDETAGAAAAIRAAGIPPDRVTMYAVNSKKDLDLPGSHTISLRGIGPYLRAIGFLRIIESARTTRPDVVIPGYIQSQLIPLPSLGAFSTRTPAPSGKQSITAFCRTNQVALQAIIDQAQGNHGLQYFIEQHDLARFGQRLDRRNRALPPGQMIAPGIYSHHLFVTELAHEATD
ncbi:hypothetical protein ACQP0C_17635 [Nocardia sp. CA-129566]|uniref:hypothetical protein n=1 Tax=Nocardia sp. CA-129566 TaxID=3239976 RepID=UPI003D998622